jgi:hypothetical protein
VRWGVAGVQDRHDPVIVLGHIAFAVRLDFPPCESAYGAVEPGPIFDLPRRRATPRTRARPWPTARP